MEITHTFRHPLSPPHRILWLEKVACFLPFFSCLFLIFLPPFLLPQGRCPVLTMCLGTTSPQSPIFMELGNTMSAFKDASGVLFPSQCVTVYRQKKKTPATQAPLLTGYHVLSNCKRFLIPQGSFPFLHQSVEIGPRNEYVDPYAYCTKASPNLMEFGQRNVSLR